MTVGFPGLGFFSMRNRIQGAKQILADPDPGLPFKHKKFIFSMKSTGTSGR
jgi:hypothetical protein